MSQLHRGLSAEKIPAEQEAKRITNVSISGCRAVATSQAHYVIFTILVSLFVKFPKHECLVLLYPPKNP